MRISLHTFRLRLFGAIFGGWIAGWGGLSAQESPLPASVPTEPALAGTPLSGEVLYARHCASCHGDSGEGVKGKYDDALHGERTLEALARYIDRTMPEEDPDVLDAEESQRVAAYIMDAFYSPAAQARLHAPQVVAARLTNRQFRESLADLIGSFGSRSEPGTGTGLTGRYFQSDGMNKKAKQVIEREDRALAFDFGEGSPGEGITADQFSIAWDGSLLAEATGWYEFRLVTPNGARFYLNVDLDRGDRNSRDDSGARRQPTLIDAWVSSGEMLRETTARVFLLGGRSYPLRLDYFKYQEKKGLVRLEWKPPRGEWSVLAAPFLSPASAAHVPVVATALPPDDASEGYERGTEVSRAWHEATTAAALEAANQVIARLRRLSGVGDDDPERVPKLKEFLATFAERAFRRPLTPALRELYVDRAFTADLASEQSVKRAVILILKSPRFLYPELGGGPVDDFTVASRLALGSWDSLPDEPLWQAAKENRLRTPEQILEQSRRLMLDPRAKAKLAVFFQRWLKLDAEGDMAKDSRTYPEFDAAISADLRRSLELFVEKVVWSDASDYRELLQADYLLLNERLAGFFGVPAPEGDDFQPVKFNPNERAGVITHPYVLSRLAYHNNSSPIHRGVFITRQILGRLLKPPVEAAAFNNDHFDPSLTMREKVIGMTSPALCMNCHDIINPLGFALENFDGTGRYRATDNGKPVDAVSDYETLAGDLVRLTGPRDLAAHAASTPDARQGFVRQLFQFVIKQNPNAYGPETIERLDTTFDAAGQSIRSLFVEINALTARHGLDGRHQASR